MKATPESLNQFTEAVKGRLGARLAAVSLELVDAGLQMGESRVIDPHSTSYKLVGWVKRPATGKVHQFEIPFRAEIEAETDVSSIDPLCASIVNACVSAFYTKVTSA